MLNFEVSKALSDLADILDLENVQWKPRAYRKAAQAIEGLSEPIEDIYRRGGIKALENIPGALAEVLMRFKTNALNLCSLHSRGIPGEPGRYLFHAEVEANAKQLPSLEGLATMRILGSLKVAI